MQPTENLMISTHESVAHILIRVAGRNERRFITQEMQKTDNNEKNTGANKTEVEVL